MLPFRRSLSGGFTFCIDLCVACSFRDADTRRCVDDTHGITSESVGLDHYIELLSLLESTITYIAGINRHNIEQLRMLLFFAMTRISPLQPEMMQVNGSLRRFETP